MDGLTRSDVLVDHGIEQADDRGAGRTPRNAELAQRPAWKFAVLSSGRRGGSSGVNCCPAARARTRPRADRRRAAREISATEDKRHARKVAPATGRQHLAVDLHVASAR
jgi:hypothetical protein